MSLLAEQPALTPHQALAMRAFMDLAGERALASEMMGPIYWRAIAAWCDRYSVQDAEQFIELVQAIDRDYLQREHTSGNPGPRNPRGTDRKVHH